jgi:kynurenine formamidase
LNSSKGFEEFIDLTHLLNSETQTFPVSWHRKVEFTPLGTMDTVGRNTTQVHIGTHSGTHIDAPSHFVSEGLTIDQIVVSRFIGEFDYINLRKSKPRTAIPVQDIMDAYPDPSSEKILILDLGWGSNFGSVNYYSDQPYLSVPASEYLLSLKPRLLGYDVAMPDNPTEGFGNDCDSPVHKMFLSQGIPLLENLKIEYPIDHLKYLVALPLKLDSLDGSPVRCVAF